MGLEDRTMARIGTIVWASAPSHMPSNSEARRWSADLEIRPTAGQFRFRTIEQFGTAEPCSRSDPTDLMGRHSPGEARLNRRGDIRAHISCQNSLDKSLIVLIRDVTSGE
ncbi:hypothetical protein BB934_00030 [Microvirga ossetica]|uniref:Uncharacterized protein n=1 Tax=Microvirga ossetica TaxID=1882682 RepID=A0A1B2E9Z2_9HYPH|nr:hypothetical protein BB934_00030 [Microvirga ossetica]